MPRVITLEERVHNETKSTDRTSSIFPARPPSFQDGEPREGGGERPKDSDLGFASQFGKDTGKGFFDLLGNMPRTTEAESVGFPHRGSRM